MAEKNNNEERVQILRMVEEGKISASEAIGLLNALSAEENTPVEPRPAPTSSSSDVVPNKTKSRFFRVRVTDTKTGRAKVMVTLPMGLVEWGMKIGAQFSPEVAQINMEDFNMLLESGIDGKLVDVLDEEDGEHVEVFVE
jgi:hypothetical protein